METNRGTYQWLHQNTSPLGVRSQQIFHELYYQSASPVKPCTHSQGGTLPETVHLSGVFIARRRNMTDANAMEIMQGTVAAIMIC